MITKESYAVAAKYLMDEWVGQYGQVNPRTVRPSLACQKAMDHISSGAATEKEMIDSFGDAAEEYVWLYMLDPGTRVRMMAYQIDCIRRHNPKRVVMGGCGACLSVTLMARSFPGVEFVGYDFSAKALEAAERRRLRLKADNLRLVLTDHAHAASEIRPAAEMIICEESYLAADEVHILSELLDPAGTFIVMATSTEEQVSRYGAAAKAAGLVEDPSGRMLFPHETMHMMYQHMANEAAREGGTVAALLMLMQNPRNAVVTDVLSYRKRRS